jgi:integrase/recombinase XerD
MRKSNRGRRFPANPLSKSEIVSLINATTRSSIGCRNRALIFLLWHCGLRLGEALALREHDIDFDAGTVRIEQGKFCKARTVGASGEALLHVQRWIDRRRTLKIDARRLLFTDLSGQPIGQNAVRECLHRLARKAGITKRVAPHQLRHTFAATVGRQIPVSQLQNALGHSSIVTTAIYLASLGDGAVDAVRGVQW